jgi:hypothetical protein
MQQHVLPLEALAEEGDASEEPQELEPHNATHGGLSLPGFSDEPIRFLDAGFWNMRRTLRLLWGFVIFSVLATLIGGQLCTLKLCKQLTRHRPALSVVLSQQKKLRKDLILNREPTLVAFIFASVFTMLTGAHSALASLSRRCSATARA